MTAALVAVALAYLVVVGGAAALAIFVGIEGHWYDTYEDVWPTGCRPRHRHQPRPCGRRESQETS